MNFSTSATNGFIDFRSDTVTRPTAAMRAAMAEAVVGDDQNGEDPTVNELEQQSARLLGKEAAVFMPSGIMGNLTSMLAHCGRGDEIIIGDESHILWYEAAGAAAVGGITPRTIATHSDGTLPLDRIEATIRQRGPGSPATAAIAIENTHNRCGGTVLPREYLVDLRKLAVEHDLPVHMDGARIFNAAAHLGVPVSDVAAHADSVQFCFSKGLAAPVGSMVVGTADFIDNVRYQRKLLGGAMRQAGVLAAPALVSLKEMIDRLPEDHRRARILAETIAEYPAYSIDLDTVQTNLVIFKTVRNQDDVIAALKEAGILASNMGSRGIRMVTHYEITDTHIERAVAALKDVAHA
jgi:threonine aldolase